MIGLAGAHRTGKTTMARETARVTGLPFVETELSLMFQQLGIDPGKPMDFQTRLMVQNVALKVCIEKWSGYTAGFLSDRTPIDLLAYTMAEVQGHTLDNATEAMMANYARQCIKAANDHFGMIMLVQPGIPIVPAPGKAALSMGYMEHLNALMAGLLVRRDVRVPVTFLSRDTLDLNERVNCLVTQYKRMIKEEFQQRVKAVAVH